MERSLVIIKPDAVQRGLAGEIISRFERKGLQLTAIKMMRLEDELLDEHYAHLSHLPFFQEIKDFMTSAPVIVTCWEGADCVATIRKLCGVTNSREAEPGTIRGDLGMSIQTNLVHASDSLETAQVELERFFAADEIFDYSLTLLPFLYSAGEAGSG